MRSKKMLVTFSSLLYLSLAPVLCASADADCAMCHDEAAVSEDHMPIDEVSVESCTMCHEAAGDDAFFKSVHDKHGEDLGCDSCHDDASDAHKA